MPSIPLLVVGTANPGKASEFMGLLRPAGIRLATLADFPNALDIDESGGSLAENARLKASRQAKHLAQWVLGDDTGLLVDALGGAPGIQTARYAGPGADGAANRRRLLAELADVPPERRTARFVCCLALADPSGETRTETEGCCGGRIALHPAGKLGFGYDALFEVVEYHRTFGQLSEAVKAHLSHRARAVARLRRHLRDLSGDPSGEVPGRP